jgi:hypothetical protein
MAYHTHVSENLPPPHHFVYVLGGAWERHQATKERLLQVAHPLLWHGCEVWATAVREAKEWHRTRSCPEGVDIWQHSYTSDLCFNCDCDPDTHHILYLDRRHYKDNFEVPVGLFDSYKTATELSTQLTALGHTAHITWEYPILGADSCWSTGSHLYNYEVLWTWFDFGRTAIAPYLDNRGKRNEGFHHFDPDAIGRPTYNAAKAAVSRAIRRLADRHLVFDFPTGLHLTPEGVQFTKALIG